MTNDFRRTLLLVVFSMSLVFLWDKWNIHNGHASMFAPRPKAEAAAVAPGAAPAPGAPVAAAAAGVVTPGAPATGGAATGEPVTVQTDVFKATFDTRGGDLVGLSLLQYPQVYNHNAVFDFFRRLVGMKTTPPPTGDVRLFERDAGQVYLAQTGLLPLAGGVSLPYHMTVMKLASQARSLAAGQDTLVVRFESPEIDGVQLVKTYTLHRGSYAIDVRHEVINHGTTTVSPTLYLQLVRDDHPVAGGASVGPSSYTGPAIYSETTAFKKLPFKDLDKAAEHNEPEALPKTDDGWVAMIQHYFASAWLLPGSAPRQFLATRNADTSVLGRPTYAVAMTTPVGAVAPGAEKAIDAKLYAGPSEEHLLAGLAPGMTLVKDYGFFKIIGQPLFWLLDKLHTLIGNWGWAIVALVVVLKIALYGLNAKAYRSMAQMRAVNPRIQALRERYKDKPQQLQQETMRIYREEKVNPLGGCLPIFVQMPIFFALYSVLNSSVEMRGAPWIGWIHDLSAMDPYMILPVLMTASSLLQVALNPTPPDPMQARMMWIMPIMFSVMFFAFPAGLVVYYVTNNLLSIVQQWLINRQFGRQAAGGATTA